LSSQDESPEIKDLRKKMREGRQPLLQVLKQAYKPYLLARKGLERKSAEIREQVGMLSSEFEEKSKQLYELSKKPDSNPATVVEMYKELSQQAKGVAALIDKELPSLEKLYQPVAKAFAAYEATLDAHNQFMQPYIGKLPKGDTDGRALQLAKQEIEHSLR
jgi:chromosome segregation ATPase